MKTIVALLFTGLASALTLAAQLVSMNGPLGGSVTGMYNEGSLVWAGTATGQIFTSTDAGRSWSFVGQPTTKSEVSCFARVGSTIIVGTATDGLYTSSDDGATWTSSEPKILPGLVRHLLVQDNYVFCTQLGLVRRSTDGGRTWTSHEVPGNTGSTQFNTLIAFAGKILVTTWNGLYASSDLGETWSQVLPNNKTAACVMDGRLYVFQDRNDYRGKTDSACLSTDDLTTWDTVSAPPSVFAAIVVDTSIIALNTSSKNTKVSSDGAATWKPFAPSFLLQRVNTAVSLGSEILLATGRTGLYRAGPDDATLAPSQNNLAATNILQLVVDRDRLLALASFEGLFSLGQGAEWSPVPSSHDGRTSYVAVARVGDTLFARSESADLNASTNDGVTWTRVTLPTSPGTGNGALHYDGRYLYVCGYSRVIRSSDAGQTWTPVASPPLARFIAMTSYGDLLWGLDKAAGVFLSTDSGDEWKPLDNSGDDEFTCLEWANDTLYVGTSRGVVFFNAAGRVLGRRFATLPITDLHVHDGRLYITTASGVVVDGKIVSGVVDATTITTFDGSIYVGTPGRGIWTCDITEVISSVPEVHMRSTVSCYPNPTCGSTQLHFSGDISPRTVKIIDLAGRTVMQAVTHENMVSIAGLEPGHYQVLIAEPGGVKSAGVIVTN